MAPIYIPQKIVSLGLNYRDHAEEQGVDLPERPLLFAKWPNTLIAQGSKTRSCTGARVTRPLRTRG